MKVLFSIEKYDGVIDINRDLYCDGYGLTKLILPEGIESLFCRNNNLTELTLPESLERVYCSENNLKSLIVPDGVDHLCCDKDLFEYDTCKAKQIHIYY